MDRSGENCNNSGATNVLEDEVLSGEQPSRCDLDPSENLPNATPLSKTQKNNRRKRKKKSRANSKAKVNGDIEENGEKLVSSENIDHNCEIEMNGPMSSQICDEGNHASVSLIINSTIKNLMDIPLSQNNSCCYESIEIPKPNWDSSFRLSAQELSEPDLGKVKIEEVAEISDENSEVHDDSYDSESDNLDVEISSTEELSGIDEKFPDISGWQPTTAPEAAMCPSLLFAPVEDLPKHIRSKETAKPTKKKQKMESEEDILRKNFYFLEKFDKFVYDPEKTTIRLRELGFIATDSEPVSIERALDSPIPTNFNLHEDASKFACHGYLVARRTAAFHGKNIVVYTHLHPWIPDMEVIPKNTTIRECINILHVYKCKYLQLKKVTGSEIGITPSNPVGPVDDRQIQPECNSISKDVASLQWLHWLKSRQTKDDFRANMKSCPPHFKEKYEVVENPTRFVGKKNYRRCVLSLQGPHEGFAIPLTDGNNVINNSSRIVLRGRRNCGMAFDGDIVLVRVNKKDESGEESGRVVGVLESIVNPVYQIFFCRVSQDQTTLMRPICGTVPKILVKNDMAVKEYEKDYLPRELQYYSFVRKHGMTTEEQTERQKREYAKKCMVSIYSPKEDNGTVDFEYQKSIKIQRLTCEKIFLVVYLNWNRYYWYPDGYVVAVISPNQSPTNDLALFRLQCQLPDDYNEDNEEDKKCLKQATTIANQQIEDEIRERKDFRDIVTFTIDNRDSRDLDDAISFQKSVDENEFVVGIHITDVAHFVKHGSDLDKAVSQRAFSVYGIANCATVHMFPENIASNCLSLIEGADRLCLAVLIRFDCETKKLKPFDVSNPEIFKSVIRSRRKLDKYVVSKCLRDAGEEIQAEMKDEVDSIPEEVKSSLADIYSCTRIMREERLKNASYVIKPDRDLKEVGSCSKAENMIEELMVEANKRVATFLKTKLPNRNLLRVHPAPDSSEVDDLVSKQGSQIKHSATVTQHLKFLEKEVDWGADADNPPILMTSDVVEAMEDAIKKGQFHLVFRLLAAEQLHPFQMMIVRDWFGLMKLAEYVRDDEKRLTSHYGLQTDAYTHFTSPLRRYCDVTVQRLLHAALSSRQLRLDLDAVADVCNEMRNRIRRYEKLVARYQLFLDAQVEPFYLPCIVSDITSPHVVLDHHIISQLPIANRRFTHGQLSLEGIDLKETVLKCTWKQRLFIAKTEVAESHPNLRDPFHRRAKPEIQNVGKLYCFTRLDKKITVSLPFLLRQRDTDRYWKNYMSRLKMECFQNQDNKMKDITSEVDRTPPKERKESKNGRPGEKKEDKKESKKIVIDSTVEFSVDIALHRPLMAQFGAPAVRTARMLAPHLQYLQICQSFGICLEHRENPAFCFVDIYEDSIKETRSYNDIDEYQKAWLPVLRLESVTESMVEENSYYLNDIDIMWMMKGKKLAGAFLLEDIFCSDSYRQIRLPKEGDRANYVDGVFSDLDYLCIRVHLEKYVWIGHAGVIMRDFLKTTKQHIVYFEVHQQSNPFPLETASQRPATVEVIMKTMPKQREEKALLALAKVDNALALNISLGSHAGLKDGMEAQCEFLKQIVRKKFMDPELRVNRCNWYQENAIKNAFKRPISIVWGPPGTGKTVTGVQMTYWYCKFNQRMESIDVQSDESDYESDYESMSDSESSSESSEDGGFQVVIGRGKVRRYDGSNESSQETKKRQYSCIVSFPSIEKEKKEEMTKPRRKRQVLYCGPSNDCINCVAEHLRTKVNARKISILRVFSELVEYDEYKVPGKDKFSRFQQNVEIPENLREISLHRLIRQKGKSYAEKLREFDAAFKESQKYLDGDPKFGKVKFEQHKEFLENLRQATLDYERVLNWAKSLEVREHDVILCTTAVAASQMLQKNCRYCQVIIDEAGMCTEPETLVPLVPVYDVYKCASMSIRNVVLIGDHKQLSPIILNNMAKELGLERSLLQRLLATAKDTSETTAATAKDTSETTAATAIDDSKTTAATAKDDSEGKAATAKDDSKTTAATAIDDSKTTAATAKDDSKTTAATAKDDSKTTAATAKDDSKTTAATAKDDSEAKATSPTDYSELDSTYTMLKVQYRMHPSICEFPSARIYSHKLRTGVSQLWSGLSKDEDIEYESRLQWNGMNPDYTAKYFYKNVLVNGDANVLHGEWPGRRVTAYDCMPYSVPSPRYNEERVAFLHVEGTETFLTRTSEEGHENSRSNEAEVKEVVRIYQELRRRFSHPRMAIKSIAVLSQYNKQVTDIREAISTSLKEEQDGSGKISRLFRRKAEKDQFKKKLEPHVSSVVRSQGSEFDYVILSTVRSLPPEDIEPSPTPGWEKKYLGFITDINQINVALTRARRGLIIIGNGNLLRVHRFWKNLLENLEARNCYVKDSTTFLKRTEVKCG